MTNWVTAYIGNVKYHLMELFNLTAVKVWISFILSLFAGNEQLYLWVILFIIIDTATGWMNAIVNHRTNSWEFWRIIIKMFGYSLAFLVVSYIEVYVFKTELYLDSMILGFMMFTEFLSIMENLKLLWVPIPSFIITEILKKIKYKPLQTAIHDKELEVRYLKEFDQILDAVKFIQDAEKFKILNTVCSVFKNVAVTINKASFYDDDTEGNKIKIVSYLEIANREAIDTLSKLNINKNLFNMYLEIVEVELKELKDDITKVIDKNIDWELKNVVMKEIWVFLYSLNSEVNKLNYN